MSDATTLILCGGLGTRLRSVIGEVPKALAPIDGQPFLDLLIPSLVRRGTRNIVLCTGYGGGAIGAYSGNGSRWNASIVVSQEPEPLGTAGAVRFAKEKIGSDPFFVVNGDSFIGVNLDRVLDQHRISGAVVTMVVTSVPDAGRYGSVEYDGEMRVTKFVEKGRQSAGSINAGLYLLNRTVVDAMPESGEVSMERDILPAYVGRGLHAFAAAEPFIDIGTPESLLLAARVLEKERQLFPVS